MTLRPKSVNLFVEGLMSPYTLACVAGVQKGGGSELGRETGLEGGGKRGRSKEVPFLSPSRAQIPASPSLFNACHAG